MRKRIGTVVGTVVASCVLGFGAGPASAKAFESLNGRIAYSAEVNEKLQIFTANPDGTGRRQLTSSGASGRPTWSPGADKIAFHSDRSGEIEVWVMNADGSDQRQLTDEPGGGTMPAWSPDGSRLVYMRSTGSNGDLWIMNSDGSNKHQLTSHADVEAYATWSPDGVQIAYSRQTVTLKPGGIGEPPTVVQNWELYRINADGTGETRLTQNIWADVDPEWRPDGQTVLFTTHASGNADIAEYENGVINMLVTGPNNEHAASVAPLGDGFAYAVNGSMVNVQDGSGTTTVVPGGNDPDWGTARTQCMGRPATQAGSSGSETLTGTSGNDVIVGLGGNDTIQGMGGDDVLCGGVGVDRVYAGVGVDRLFGDAGNDYLSGGDGNDTLVGGLGADAMSGDAGVDVATYSDYGSAVRITIGDGKANDGNANDGSADNVGATIENVRGSRASDVIYGNSLANQIYGEAGNDTLIGNSGNDRLSGDAGADSLYGNVGHDYLYGFDGNDKLYGYVGNDYLNGGSGADVLDGQADRDTLYAKDGIRDSLINCGTGTDPTPVRDAGDPTPIGCP